LIAFNARADKLCCHLQCVKECHLISPNYFSNMINHTIKKTAAALSQGRFFLNYTSTTFHSVPFLIKRPSTRCT